MKKARNILILLLIAIVMALCTIGCGGQEQDDLQSKIYTLQEAYDKGYLTQDDLFSIAYYNGDKMINEELMPEDYTPQPKKPNTLDEQTELKIKYTAAEKFKEEYKYIIVEVDGFRIDKYYGTYGDCVAVMMSDDYTGYPAVVWIDNVGQVHFEYWSGNSIKIWRKA